MLSEAGAVYDVIITQRANHALDLMQGLSLHLYHAIAVVAGDGLLYEVSDLLFVGVAGDGLQSEVSNLLVEVAAGNSLPDICEMLISVVARRWPAL